MREDRLQMNDGSMAKSPKECGGVVMKRESMMKKSMHSVMRVALVAVMALVYMGGFGAVEQAEAAYTDPIYMNVYAVDGSGTKITEYTQEVQFWLEVVLTDFYGNPVSGEVASMSLNAADSGGPVYDYTLGNANIGSWSEVGSTGVYRLPIEITARGGYTFFEVRSTAGAYSRLEGSTNLDESIDGPTGYVAQFDAVPLATCYDDSAPTVGFKLSAKELDGTPVSGLTYDPGFVNALNEYELKEFAYISDRNNNPGFTNASCSEDGSTGTYDCSFDITTNPMTPLGIYYATFELQSNGNGDAMVAIAAFNVSNDCAATSPPPVPPNPNAPEISPVTCTEAAPTVTFSTANQTITTDGGNAVYNYTVTNNDSGGACGSTTFAIGVSDDSGLFTSTRTPTSVTLAEGATSGTLTMTVTDTSAPNLDSTISTITASEGTHSDGTATRTTDINIPCTPSGTILWNGTTTANGDFSGASLVGSTSNISGNVEYQVTGSGNWGSCRTESGRATLTGTGGTVTLGTAIADLSQAFVVVDSTHADVVGNSLESDFAATGEITDASTLTFTRVGTNSDLEVSYQLVECFNNEFNVQRGDITLTGAATTNTASVTAVDTTKSMVLINSRSANAVNQTNQHLIIGEMSNATTVTATRDAASAGAVAHYQVVEFNPAAIVSLQTGEVSVTGTIAAPTTVNLPTAVNDGSSWLYFTEANAASNMDDTAIAGNLANAGADLTFYHEGVTTPARIRWYVVEFPNDGTVSVQRGVSSFAGAADPATFNISVPTAVNSVTKAFSYTTNTTSGNGSAFPRHLWVERLSTTSNIELQGWNTDTVNADAEHEWQVIEFIDGGTSVLIPWSVDPLAPAASTVLANGNSYNVYARALDGTCTSVYVYGDTALTNTTPDGVTKGVTWSSCNETATLTLNPVTDPITGAVSVTASGTATNIKVGTDPLNLTNNSGWVYTPAGDDNTTLVSFYATGDGICSPRSQLNVSTNTMAAPTITNFTVSGSVVDTAAPYVIPITTFTATDNVAVTGYIITVDDPTPPASGAAGWTGTAPTSVTVAGYATYTLRAYAKDAAGNVSAASSASVTVINCTPGTITSNTGTLPNPVISATIDFSGYVSLNNSGDSTVSNAMYSVDGAAYVSVATPYTLIAKDSGTINVKFKADDSCSGTVYDDNNLDDGTGPGYVINYDTRVAALEPTVQSVVQVNLTTFRVTMVYCNDSNGTGTFQVEYKLSTDADIPANWTTVTNTPTADGGAGDTDGTLNEDVIVTQSGLTSGLIYDVRMTYIDGTDGVIGTAVYDLQVELIAWSDNVLLHNSNRFAGTPKHGGDWGTTTGYGGGFTCDTCHGKNTGNVKKVKTQISFPDGSVMPGGGITTTVVLQSVADGTSDFGDDSGGARSSSSRVCEACHTYDGTADYASRVNGVDQHAADQAVAAGHFDNTDCIKCHLHKVGFKAECTGCHAYPPVNAGGLDTSVGTGSATAGKHQLHAIDKAYDCNTCHTGWEAASQMPNGGSINLGFNVSLGTTTDTTGTYDGRSAGTYNTAAGTTNSAGSGLTCSAIYCHGAASPTWNDAGTAACGTCHGDGSGAPLPTGTGDLDGLNAGPKVGKHAEHIAKGYACSLCHNGAGDGTAKHVDGANDIVFSGAAAGAVFTPNEVPGGTCSSLSCHGDQIWNTSSAALACNSCHGYPPTSSADAANNKHVGSTPVNHDKFIAGDTSAITGNHSECNVCHGFSSATGASDNTGSGGDAYLLSYHQDGNIEMNGISLNPIDDGQSTDYRESGVGAYGCNSACHTINDAPHQLSGSSFPVQFGEYGGGDCDGCHDGSGAAGTATWINNTRTHTLVDTGLTCAECHGAHNAGTVQVPNNATVGISYSFGGIDLGAAGTAPGATEAEICWNCHTTQSAWGTNNNADGITYDYGTLSNNAASSGGWYSNVSVGSEAGATWTSPVFSYKTGAIQSTHTANTIKPVVDAVLTGGNYAKVEKVNAVADIRCSYCHDVHNLNKLASDNSTGKPYLRGTWKGNPYREDGAPRNGAAGTWLTVTSGANSGQMPRVNAGAGNSTTKGGFWIDQNSGNPNSTATLANSAGLCTLCHGTNVDTMDQTTGEGLWVSGGNGHQNAVIGGSGTTATANNIFSIRKRGSNRVADDNGNSYYMSMGGWTPQMARRAFGIRGDQGIGLAPVMAGEHRYFQGFQWDNPPAGMALVVDDYAMEGNSTVTKAAETQSKYHTFNCGKCHNPHASRLPKLMITNCLDTAQNTWDETINVGATGAPSPWTGTDASQWPSAQNCHRLADDHSTLTRGAGWNTVTPW